MGNGRWGIEQMRVNRLSFMEKRIIFAVAKQPFPKCTFRKSIPSFSEMGKLFLLKFKFRM